jgi:hypothetical protein
MSIPIFFLQLFIFILFYFFSVHTREEEKAFLVDSLMGTRITHFA